MSFAEWSWLVRDVKPKPHGGHCLAVLWMMAARMDPVTGCGWTNREQVATDAGCGENTVTAATRWALEHFLVRRLVRGHRITGAKSTDSLWILTDPSVQDADPGPGPTSKPGTVGSPGPTSKPGIVGIVPTSKPGIVGIVPTSKPGIVGIVPTCKLGPTQPPSGASLQIDQEVRPGLKDPVAGPVTPARAPAHTRANGRRDPGPVTRPDPALDLVAARIHADHVRACRPPMPREQVRQMGELISELVGYGRHDPAVVAASLGQWRERRGLGQNVGGGLLTWLIEQAELAAIREGGPPDPDDAAPMCTGCYGFHRETDPCFT